MKITKNQLKRIIKEERAKLIKEQQNFSHPKTGENLYLMLNDAIDKLLDQGADPIELANELRGLADDVEDSKPVEGR